VLSLNHSFVKLLESNVIFFFFYQTLVAQRQQAITQDVPTEQQSLTLMRNLLRTSISCICYLRNLFDESCFIDKNLTGKCKTEVLHYKRQLNIFYFRA